MIQENKHYINNFIWLSIDVISKGLIVALSNYFIFNSISKSDYGEISITTNIILVLYSLLSFGSNFTYLKRYSLINSNEEFNNEYSSALSLRIILSIFSLLIILIFYSSNYINFPIFLIYTTLCFELIIVYNEITLAKNKNEYKTYSNFFSDIIYFIIIFFLFETDNLNLSSLAACISLRTFLKMCFFIYYGKQKLDLVFKFNFDYLYSKKLLKESYPLIFSSISNLYLIVSVQFMIKYFNGDDVLGTFSAGYYLISLITVFFGVFSNSFNSYTIKNNEIKGKNSKLISFIFYISLIIVLFSFFIGDNLLYFYFSKNFDKAIVIFKNFLPYLSIVSFKPILDKLLVYKGQSSLLAKRNVFTLAFNTIFISLILYIELSYEYIPFVFFISELFVLIYYSINKKTYFIFYEIKHGILYNHFK